MLDRTEYMPLEYFKKQKWSGSFQGMRFMFEKQMEKTVTVKDGAETETESPYLMVTIWKEPYSYEATPDEKKQRERFDLSEDGRQKAIEWLEQQYADRQDEWKQAMKWDWEQETVEIS